MDWLILARQGSHILNLANSFWFQLPFRLAIFRTENFLTGLMIVFIAPGHCQPTASICCMGRTGTGA